jgi:hypothetical protein
MTPDLLHECGEALYGKQWQSALARDLKVADRTIRRWAVGAFSMPPSLADELRELLNARGIMLAAVQRKLS